MYEKRYKVLIISLLSEGVVLVLALLSAEYFGINLFPLTESLSRDLLVGAAGAAPPFMLFLFIISKKAGNISLFSSVRKTVLVDVREIFLSVGLFDLVLISLLAGFAEELLFRGVLQAEFGIVAASILFGLIHCISPAYVIVTTLMGFYIGALYLVSGSLMVPVQVHFIYDLAALVYLRYFARDS